MKQHKFFLYLLLMVFCTFASSCSRAEFSYASLKNGVDEELAQFRKSEYGNVSYNLFFSLPESKADKVEGTIDITFTLDKKQPVIIDFRAGEKSINDVKLNGIRVFYKFVNEHVVIEKDCVENGENCVSISFTPNDQSLNRRDEYMYTLLVPDRARTLFPCFDQPDLKAVYKLSLDVPLEWAVLSNSAVDTTKLLSNTRIKYFFKETEPLSTYLFSFVAGNFQRETFTKDGRSINILYRETDTNKIAQCCSIADEVFAAMDWMEDYTGVPYPFSKYDLAILPGFQYGGMEHTGATLYNDSRMFLSGQPTLNERLRRSSLIAHETAHMWFGDYVTMKWFNDVWTKEVFANYFAAKMVEPRYPQVNHRLNFIQSYLPSAYYEDRTDGATPIQQDLDNLNNAGLVYCNIIYNKSPIVMEMLAQIMGEEQFKTGIREYLKEYAYGNATWDNLINILDKYTCNNLKTWSNAWVHEAGMPAILSCIEDSTLVVAQYDKRGRNLCWPQSVKYLVGNKEVTVNLNDNVNEKDSVLSFKVDSSTLVIPNIDGRSYGYFFIPDDQKDSFAAVMNSTDNDVLKGSIMQMLYENVLLSSINAQWFVDNMLLFAHTQKNQQLYSAAINYAASCHIQFGTDVQKAENSLWNIVSTTFDNSKKLLAFRAYENVAESKEAVEKLFDIWKNMQSPFGCLLSDNDFVNLSYKLAVLMPERSDYITSTQLERIKDPDKKSKYEYILPSVSPRQAERDSVFQSLLIPENRRIEPWAAEALANLNNRFRDKESVGYIRPALEALKDIQRTGDIFFPSSWIGSLIGGHHSKEAIAEVEKFLDDNPEYPQLLKNKILQRFWYMSGGKN